MHVETDLSFHLFVPHENSDDLKKKRCAKVCLWGAPDEQDTDKLMAELNIAEGDKINHYMRSIHSSPLQSISNRMASCHQKGVAKKCLFGRPCQEDIHDLLAQQLASDKSRFLELYGIDIDALENLRKLSKTSSSRKRKHEKSPRKSPSSSRRSLQFHSRKITDFYRTSKNVGTQPDKTT